MIDQIPSAGWLAIVSIVSSLVGWAATRGKNSADVHATISDTSLEWIRELRDDRDRTRSRLEKVELDNRYLRRRGIALETRLREEGIDPAEINGPHGPPLTND